MRMVTRGKYEIPAHVALLDRKLRELFYGRLNGLIVAEPPRHGKSNLISRGLPAWWIGRRPDNRVLLGSYEGTLAASWGRKARDIVQLHGPSLFGVTTRQDSKAAEHWNIHGRDGGMDTAGVGGSFTGRGGNLVIMDDPIKNAEQANSQTYREKIWDFWMSTIETRAEPGCKFVLVQTRWHKDDLAGRVLAQIENGEYKGWEHLRLPALSEGKDDLLGRPEGEALWPERFPKEALLELKNRWNADTARLGPYWWDAIYQQRPAPKSGGQFKRAWFRYFKQDDTYYYLDDRTFEKDECWKFFTIDLAASEKESADFFVVGVWAVTPEGDLLLVDLVRDKITSPEKRRLILRMYVRYQPVFIGVESNAYQLSMVQELEAKGLPAEAIPAKGDKVARSMVAQTRMKIGKMWLRSSAPWLTEVEDELAFFPKGEHDDIVDVVSMAANKLADYAVPEIS